MSEEEKSKAVSDYFLNKQIDTSQKNIEEKVDENKKDETFSNDFPIYLRTNGETLDDPFAIKSCKNEQNRDIIENGRLGSYDRYGNYVFIPEIRQELVEMPKLVYNTSIVEDKTTYDLRARIPIFGDLYFKLKINKYEAKLVLIENVTREAGQYVEVYEELVDSIALSEKEPISQKAIFTLFHIFESDDDYGMEYEGYYGFENILLKKIYMGLLAKEIKQLVAVDEHECYQEMIEIIEASGEYGERIKKEFLTRLRDRRQIFDIKEEYVYDRAINEVLLSSIDVATTPKDKENPKTRVVYDKLINVRNKNLAKYIKQAEKQVDEKYVEDVKDRAVQSFVQKNYEKSKEIKLEYVSRLSFTNKKEKKAELDKIKKEKHIVEKPLMKQLTKAKQEQEQVAQQEQVEKQQETEEKPLTKEEKIAQIIEKKEKQKEEQAKEKKKEPSKGPKESEKKTEKKQEKSGEKKSDKKNDKKVKPATAQKEKSNSPKKQNDKPKANKPKADKPKADKPKADKPKANKPKADKPKQNDKPKKNDKPKADKPKADKPKTNKPKADKPKQNDKPKQQKGKDNTKKASKPTVKNGERVKKSGNPEKTRVNNQKLKTQNPTKTQKDKTVQGIKERVLSGVVASKTQTASNRTNTPQVVLNGASKTQTVLNNNRNTDIKRKFVESFVLEKSNPPVQKSQKEIGDNGKVPEQPAIKVESKKRKYDFGELYPEFTARDYATTLEQQNETNASKKKEFEENLVETNLGPNKGESFKERVETPSSSSVPEQRKGFEKIKEDVVVEKHTPTNVSDGTNFAEVDVENKRKSNVEEKRAGEQSIAGKFDVESQTIHEEQEQIHNDKGQDEMIINF